MLFVNLLADKNYIKTESLMETGEMIEQVLKESIEREQAQFWDIEQLEEKAENLACLATIIGTLDTTDMDNLRGKHQKYEEFYSNGKEPEIIRQAFCALGYGVKHDIGKNYLFWPALQIFGNSTRTKKIKKWLML